MAASAQHDIEVLRPLAQRYAEIAAKPIQEERRKLSADHNSLRTTRPPVLATYGMWNVWCREVYGDHAMSCRDPFYRNYERWLRMEIYHDGIGDDWIQEPWITVPAVQKVNWDNLWGPSLGHTGLGVEGSAWKFDPAIKEWSDVAKLIAPPHEIDEKATAANVERLHDAIGDILTINVTRGAACLAYMADISTHFGQLRGLEQFMLDMYESPRELHHVLAFMRDGILANQAAAENAGDYGLTDQSNLCMTYCHELPRPRPNAFGAKRNQLWGFAAGQEFTSVSPAMHDEFLLQYQKPIMEQFGLMSYGCCEDLTNKIDMLRQVKNLRMIGVTPRADVRRCAEQIGQDYVISWRPNPTDMVCCGFDEPSIRKTLREGLAACRDCHVHLHLKDVETVQGEPDRLGRWVRIVSDLL